MKILAIDDQQLILLSIEKHLTELGYEVQTAMSTEQGIQMYNTFNPDLVLLDMNMPEMAGTQLVSCTGTEVVKYIRLFRKRKTPILVMSGNDNPKVVNENFSLGVNDYITKPITLDEMTSRILRLTTTLTYEKITLNPKSNGIIEKDCIGVVIPCYNDEKILLDDRFRYFLEKNINFHVCFVNYGSTDHTLQVLYELRQGHESMITIINCKTEIGRSNAIRKGILHLSKDPQYTYIGYLSSASYTDFDALVKKTGNTGFKVRNRKRKSTLVNDKQRKKAAKIGWLVPEFFLSFPWAISRHFRLRRSLLMRREVVTKLFKEKFKTNRMMGVEIVLRMRKRFCQSELIGMHSRRWEETYGD